MFCLTGFRWIGRGDDEGLKFLGSHGVGVGAYGGPTKSPRFIGFRVSGLGFRVIPSGCPRIRRKHPKALHCKPKLQC